MAGTGDRASPCERATTPRLPAPARAPGPGGHPAPSGRSRGLGCGRASERAGGLRGLEPLRRETSLLHPGSRQHVTVSSALPVSKRARECVGRGGRGAAAGRTGGRARGSGSHNRPSSLRSPRRHRRRGPPRTSRLARFPGPGLPLPAAAPVHRSSPSCRTHAPGSLGVGSGHLAFASLPCLRLRREESPPPGRWKGRRDPSLAAGGEEAASMQIWEVSCCIPADPHAVSGWEITCLVLTQGRSVCTAAAVGPPRTPGCRAGAPWKQAGFLPGSPSGSRGRQPRYQMTPPPLPPILSTPTSGLNPKLFFHVVTNHRKVVLEF